MIALRIFPASAEEQRVHGALSLHEMFASRSSVPLDGDAKRSAGDDQKR